MINNYIVSSDFKTWEKLNEQLAEPLEKGKKLYITINDEPPRSANANSLSHCYYEKIAEHTGNSIAWAKAHCKLDFGLDVLWIQAKEKGKHGVDAQDVLDMLRAISFKTMSYNKKLRVIRPTPLTSLLSKTNFNTYLKQIELFYFEQGLILQSNK